MKKVVSLLLAAVMVFTVACTAGFVGIAETLSHKIYINEICSGNNGKEGNLTDFKDDDGDYCDWIELYNPSDAAVDLSGWGISDDVEKPMKSTLPNGTEIAAKGYLIIYCSKALAAPTAPVGVFGISGDGEDIKLTDSTGAAVDLVALPALKNDTTYGRYPDGSDRLCVMTLSPRATNNKAVLTLAGPEFSKDSGFMADGFELTISSAETDGEIYYTSDGSDPQHSETAMKYTEPLRVKDRTGEKNVLSAIPCSEFGPANPNTKVPSDTNVDKSTVIRACVKDSSGYFSETVSKTYFVGEKTSSYGETAVISMTIDKSSLFDYNTGIYCKGVKYDEYIKDHVGEKDYWGTKGNFSEKGSEWERECHIDFFESDGSLAFEQNCGVRIQGGVSRSSIQKSLRFLASAKYGNKYFEHEIFPNSYNTQGEVLQKHKTFVLRNGGNDADTKFPDAFNQSNLYNRSIETQRSRSCLLFLNGEFWGYYVMQEDYTEHYVAQKYGVDPDNVIIYKNWKIDVGTDEDKKLSSELTNFVGYQNLIDENNYKKATELMDIQSFADYMAGELYIGNTDWPTGNFGFWRTRVAEEGNPYGDCRWRFMLFDTEFSMSLFGNANSKYSYDRITELVKATASKPPFLAVMLKNMLTNYEFKQLFAKTFTDIANISFEYSQASDRLDTIYRHDYPYLKMNNLRYACFNLGTASNRYASIDEFVENRAKYAMKFMGKALGMSGNLSTLEITSNIAAAGDIITDTDKIILDNIKSNRFTGYYFIEKSANLTAQPREGYKFVGWSGAITSAEPEISVDMSASQKLQANYELISQPTTEPTTVPTTVPPTTQPTTAAILYGDCNHDTQINAKDLLILKKYFADWVVDIDLAASDTLFDGFVNAKDLLQLKKYLADHPVVLGPAK